MDATTSLANRASEVSDALDSMPEGVAACVWTDAHKFYATGDHSFLAAFELAIEKNR